MTIDTYINYVAPAELLVYGLVLAFGGLWFIAWLERNESHRSKAAGE